jgi:hypothetical protein
MWPDGAYRTADKSTPDLAAGLARRFFCVFCFLVVRALVIHLALVDDVYITALAIERLIVVKDFTELICTSLS